MMHMIMKMLWLSHRRVSRRLHVVITVLPAPGQFLIFGLSPRLMTTHFLRLLSVTTQGTSSSLQFVHGAPCSTTLQRTFRALQH